MPVHPGLVSTIVTVFNRPLLVQDAVASVLAQTYRPLEIVIVDDGSTDDTAAVCDAMAEQHPGVIRVVHQANRGPAGATNAGLELITGEFVQFLDSDDLLGPGKFARQVAGLRANPQCGLAYCQVREYDLGEAWSGQPARRSGQQHDPLFPALLDGRLWPTVSALYRRSVVDDNGPFLSFRIYQDWEFECRAARRGVRAWHCAEYLADMRRAHAQEGRTKAVTGSKLVELAQVLETILEHGRAAGADSRSLARFGRRLFETSERCALGGYSADAMRLLRQSMALAPAPRRRWLVVYRAVAVVAGVQRAARLRQALARSFIVTSWYASRTVLRARYAAWRHRLCEASATIAGQPVVRWPALLWQRWRNRRSQWGHVRA